MQVEFRGVNYSLNDYEKFEGYDSKGNTIELSRNEALKAIMERTYHTIILKSENEKAAIKPHEVNRIELFK